MDKFKNYYRVLNLDPTADEAAIKAAFRQLARRHHPDLARNARAALRFHEIREAYEVLYDPQRRRQYDAIYRARTALRPVTRGQGTPGTATRGSAGLGITLDVLGLRLGLSVGAGAARKEQRPRSRPKKR